MQTHSASCLTGPLSRSRPWWQHLGSSTPELDVEEFLAETNADEELFRPELVARIRREIANGTYDSPDKWELALDRLLQRLEEVSEE